MKTREQVNAFLDEIEAVCRKHGISIDHEDSHGAFVYNDFDERDLDHMGGGFYSPSGGEIDWVKRRDWKRARS